MGKEVLENVFEDGGIDGVPGIRKAAKADGPGADFFLDSGELAGKLEAAQAAGDGVVKAQEKEGKVVAQQETAFGVGE